MRNLLLLAFASILALATGCVAGPNPENEWTASDGSTTKSMLDGSESSSEVTATAPEIVGPRVVMPILGGAPILGFPLGNASGPGPILVQPLTGGLPRLGFLLD